MLKPSGCVRVWDFFFFFFNVHRKRSVNASDSPVSLHVGMDLIHKCQRLSPLEKSTCESNLFIYLSSPRFVKAFMHHNPRLQTRTHIHTRAMFSLVRRAAADGQLVPVWSAV